MSNNFGAFAAITTDLAGTEHSVWEHQGALWYTYFDANANQWSNAEPVSDASGGGNRFCCLYDELRALALQTGIK